MTREGLDLRDHTCPPPRFSPMCHVKDVKDDCLSPLRDHDPMRTAVSHNDCASGFICLFHFSTAYILVV